MGQVLLNSGGSNLKFLGLAAGFAFVGVMAACAEAPVDPDPGGQTQSVNKAEAEPTGESQKLPPSNPPAKKEETNDAGTSSSSSGGASSSSSSSGSSTSSSSGGSSSGSTSSSSGGSSSGGSTSSSGGAGASCDMNDPLNLIKALDETGKASPRTCGLMGGSCKATECCFDVYGVCIDP